MARNAASRGEGLKKRVPSVRIPKDAMNPVELAALLQVTPQAVRNWIKSDKDPLPARAVKKRERTYYYISEREALPWLKKQGLID